jgi:PKD repeat protein
VFWLTIKQQRTFDTETISQQLNRLHMKKLLLLTCILIGCWAGAYAQNCRADFMYGTNPGTTVASFYDSSYVTNGGTVSTWSWSFGDGSSSNDQNPVHTYNTAGSYYVCLVISSNYLGSTCTSDHCDTIVVGGAPGCGAAFQASAVGANGLEYEFGNYSSGIGLNYYWTFGDGDTSSLFDPHHTYGQPGDYAVCLTVYNSNGCQDSYCDSIHVQYSTGNCDAQFSYSAQVAHANIIEFYNSSTGANNYTTYAWSFGDSTTSTDGSPVHTYASTGTYQVCLAMNTHDANGNTLCTSYECHNVTINNGGGCSAAYQSTVTGGNGLTYHFDNYSTGSNLTYVWDFGDNHDAVTFDPSHTYGQPGTYTVCLTVSGGGCTSTYCDSINVQYSTGNCDAQFTATPQSFFPSTIEFANTSTGANNYTTYTWDFGDGSNSVLASPTHSFGSNGTYQVCLAMYTHDANGTTLCTSYECHNIIIGGASGSCDAQFTYVSPPANPYHIEFVNNSTGGSNVNVVYTWSFGDGTSGTGFDPTHNYNSNGPFLVCLTMTTYDSLQNVVCVDDKCDSVVIGGGSVGCDATFQYGFGTNNLVEYYFTGSGNNITYAWNLGDGSTSNDANPHHTYATAGTYYVCLTITSASGGTVNCTDSFCDSVTVGNSGQCQAYFSPTQAPVNLLEFSFTNYSTGFNPVYTWNFGDGTSSHNFDPSHTYATAGTYVVCLTLVDTAINCTSSFCDTIYAGSNAGPYNISGVIYRGNSRAAAATVYLIRLDSVNLVGVDTVGTINGEYIFHNVPQGLYYVKAALTPNDPDYHAYLPTYYGDELFWNQATTLIVNQDMTGAGILLQHGVNPGGPGFVGGNVFQGANKIGDAGDPLQNIQVMLLNMDDSPVQYTYTDASGAYSFDNVGYGTYKVYAEVTGIPTTPSIITISAAAEVRENVVIVIESDKVVSGVGNSIDLINDVTVYPNPMTGTGVLRMNVSREAMVTITLTNLLGQQVMNTTQQLTNGRNDILLDLTSKANGIYILNITNDNGAKSVFRIVKQ